MQEKPKSNIFQISDTQLWNKINNCFSTKGGIYKVIAIDNGQPIPIPRLLDIDSQGILYIGMAKSFLERVIILKTSTDPTYASSNHEFGVRYKEHPKIRVKFPFEKLYVYIEESDNPDKLETDLLNMYYKEFGELPPFIRNKKTEK